MNPELFAWRRWAGPALIAAAFGFMAWWTWGAWTDPLVDFGRELYYPWRIAGGQVMYRDMASLFGPLSPYFNAALFKLFGVGLVTLVAANLALLALLLALLYAILARLGSRFGATVACLVALTVFAFGRYTLAGAFNFVCPYTHSATHGLILGLAAVYFMARYHQRPAGGWVAAAGFCLGLAFLTKSEMFVAVLAAVAAGFALAGCGHGFTRRRWVRAAAILCGAAALPALGAWALLCLAMPAGEALRGTLGSWLYTFDPRIVNLRFYRVGMGTDDVPRNLGIMLRYAGWYAVLFGAAALLMLACRRRGWHRIVLAAILVVALGGLVLWLADQDAKEGRLPLALLPRPWPAVMAALAVAALAWFIRTRRDPDGGRRAALAVTMAIFALALLLKIVLNCRVYHYGFALALPAGALLVTALLDWAPGLLGRSGGYAAGFRALALSAIIAAAWAHLGVTDSNLAKFRTPVGAGADAFLACDFGENKLGERIQSGLDAVAREVPSGRTLAVLPDGAMINYLSRRPNPSPYIAFIDGELLAFGAERMTRSYQEHPPDYVLLIHRVTTDYDQPLFGKDYGQELCQWIMSRYRPVALVGDMPLQSPNQLFGMLLLRRQDAPP